MFHSASHTTHLITYHLVHTLHHMALSTCMLLHLPLLPNRMLIGCSSCGNVQSLVCLFALYRDRQLTGDLLLLSHGVLRKLCGLDE